MPLPDDVTLYPAHGAHRLCGKGLSDANSSTMVQEKQTNWALQPLTEEAFVQTLLSDQPFIPAYFPYNVSINRQGAAPFNESVEAVKIGSTINSETEAQVLDKDIVIVDARNDKEFKKGHLSNAINLNGRCKV